MVKTDIIAIFEAIKICKMYKENAAADMLIDILDDYISADPLENTSDPMTDEHADIIGEALNICDKIGKYGTGDILLDIINKHQTNEAI